jgi:hypothetical protein
MNEVTIKDLMDVIHYTIIQKNGENTKFIDEVRRLDFLIFSGELENFSVEQTPLWQTIVRLNKTDKNPPIYY